MIKWIFPGIVLFQFAATGIAAAPLGCLITPKQEADIGTPVIGVIESVEVERGDRVQEGQVLAVLQSHVEAASVNVARARARVEAELRAATAGLALAESRYQRAVDLHRKAFISRQALDQSSAELEVARQQVAQSHEQLHVFGREEALAQAQLTQRVLRAPFAGVISDRMVQPGERVEDRPLLRLAAIDELRAEVVMPASAFGTIQVGSEATVSPDIPGMAPIQARVGIVDPIVDAASNTFRIRLGIDNSTGAIPAGVRCHASFPSTRASTTAAAAPTGHASE